MCLREKEREKERKRERNRERERERETRTHTHARTWRWLHFEVVVRVPNSFAFVPFAKGVVVVTQPSYLAGS